MEATRDHVRLERLPAFTARAAEVSHRPGDVPAAKGFTLLEVLIAFVIASLALAALYDAVTSGLRTTQIASHYEQAVSRASSRLEMATHATPLVAGTWRGDDGGGFNWRVRVTPVATTTVQPVYRPASRMAADFRVVLYGVTVWISWRDGGAREVRLDTERIGEGVQ